MNRFERFTFSLACMAFVCAAIDYMEKNRREATREARQIKALERAACYALLHSVEKSQSTEGTPHEEGR